MVKFPTLLEGFDVEPDADGTLLDIDQVIECLRDILECKADPKLVISHLEGWLSYLTSQE